MRFGEGKMAEIIGSCGVAMWGGALRLAALCSYQAVEGAVGIVWRYCRDSMKSLNRAVY